jgi:hypothetical protein
MAMELIKGSGIFIERLVTNSIQMPCSRCSSFIAKRRELRWEVLCGLPRKQSMGSWCSVFHAYTDYDKHRLVLLRTALDCRHRAS